MRCCKQYGVAGSERGPPIAKWLNCTAVYMWYLWGMCKKVHWLPLDFETVTIYILLIYEQIKTLKIPAMKGKVTFMFWPTNSPYYHPLSENHDFSGTEPPLDLRPVCKLNFVRCGPGEKNRALYLSRLKRGGLMKFENTFFQIEKLRFSSIFVDFRQISRIFKKISGNQFKIWGPQILDSTPLYAYLSPCKNRICKIHQNVGF